MNSRQKRIRTARIRAGQKATREAKRPQPLKPLSLQESIVLTRRFIAENEGYVIKDAKNIASFKFLLRLASLSYVVYVFFSVYFWKKDDDILMILLGGCILIFFSFMYFSYKNGTKYWVVDLEEKRRYLKELELQLLTSS